MIAEEIQRIGVKSADALHVACLIEKLGVVNAERFIAMIKRENFDYTIWRREYFGNVGLEELNREAANYVEKNPHKGQGIRV